MHTAGGQVVRRSRLKQLRPGIAPPPPSPQYRADARYVAHTDFPSETRRQAMANHRAWHDHHARASDQVCNWLGANGVLGDEAKAAYTARARSGETRQRARAAVDTAKAAHAQAQQHLTELAFAYLESDKAALPTGAEVIAAGQAVEAAKLAAQAVEAACDQGRQRWGRILVRANWSEVLARAEQAKGSDAEVAVAWLKAKVYPPPGPGEDVLGWI